MAVRRPDFYRYFLCFRPGSDVRRWLASVAEAAGQFQRRIRPEYLHLTLCVLAERPGRDRFIASRVDAALERHRLSASPIRFGRVRGGRVGAAVYTTGRQHELQAFRRALLRHLAELGLVPIHDGWRPHVTLGYDPCRLDPFVDSREWTPCEILLIESEVGNTVHRVLGRWPLMDPPQGRLPFGESPASVPSVPGGVATDGHNRVQRIGSGPDLAAAGML